MNLLEKALLMTEANLSNTKAAKSQVKDKRQVVYKTPTGLHYLVPGNMKIKSFDRLVNKNADAIDDFKSSDKTSINLS